MWWWLWHLAQYSAPEPEPKAPFTRAFTVSSSAERLWIQPSDGSTYRTELQIKGVVWLGFQRNGCPAGLEQRHVQYYTDFLNTHKFNAIRLPLSAALVNADRTVGSECGMYNGWRTMDVLDEILVRPLAQASASAWS